MQRFVLTDDDVQTLIREAAFYLNDAIVSNKSLNRAQEQYVKFARNFVQSRHQDCKVECASERKPPTKRSRLTLQELDFKQRHPLVYLQDRALYLRERQRLARLRLRLAESGEDVPELPPRAALIDRPTATQRRRIPPALTRVLDLMRLRESVATANQKRAFEKRLLVAQMRLLLVLSETD